MSLPSRHMRRPKTTPRQPQKTSARASAHDRMCRGFHAHKPATARPPNCMQHLRATRRLFIHQAVAGRELSGGLVLLARQTSSVAGTSGRRERVLLVE